MTFPTVALTYDDGPSQWTPALLDVLADHDAHATFFVLGCHIAGREDTLRRIVEEGHAVGLHGMTHTRGLVALEMLGELDATRDLVYRATDVRPTLWRPPWHEAAYTITGYERVEVDVDGYDVSRGEHRIVRAVVPRLRDGIIVGLHDGIAPNGEQHVRSRDATVRATARILGHCRSVTVSDLRASVAA